MDIERAIIIAAEAHSGQRDKLGEPYIQHPLRVMLSVAWHSPSAQTVAALHDVVEDCPNWPLARLVSEGLSEAEALAIDAITKRRGEPYKDYLCRVYGNELAYTVKLADIEDNTSPRRAAGLSEHRRAKYAMAREFLENRP
jgi:hypothetical protein